jgi:hypothetical protein
VLVLYQFWYSTSTVLVLVLLGRFLVIEVILQLLTASTACTGTIISGTASTIITGTTGTTVLAGKW